jgi:hypothetical protein
MSAALPKVALTAALKGLVRDSALHRWQQLKVDRREVAAWEKAGRGLPPPQAFKKQLIRDFGRRFETRVLVETGTYWGHTIAGSLGVFKTIYSIELKDAFYQHARRRFARHRNVKLFHGDSATQLPRILWELNEPALFWLDAHYSGDGTARGDVDTPIVAELRAISQHRLKTHVILIDDARCFDGTNDYPTLTACKTLSTGFWPASRFEVADDVIRITCKPII